MGFIGSQQVIVSITVKQAGGSSLGWGVLISIEEEVMRLGVLMIIDNFSVLAGLQSTLL